MNNPIVSNLFRNRPKLEFLNENNKSLREAGEDSEEATGADDEYAALNDEEDEEHDDSQAPEQGNPEDEEPKDDSALDDKIPSSSHSPLPSHASEDVPEEPEIEEVPEEKPDRKEQAPEGYDNPLDNPYAVKFTLGDDILLSHTGATIEPRKGVVDGYDTEGFYRVKWSDGSTTNGLTDIALAELVEVPQRESKCPCGCKEFVEENHNLLCDRCGRILESSDPLMLADKSRPKGKRMIRSEAHPISTAVKPSIAENIRKALRGEKLIEEDDLENEEKAFSRLKKLDGEFWTRQQELTADIEELGYQIEEINTEYVVVSSDEDEDNVYKIPIVGTSRTMNLDLDKAYMI